MVENNQQTKRQTPERRTQSAPARLPARLDAPIFKLRAKQHRVSIIFSLFIFRPILLWNYSTQNIHQEIISNKVEKLLQFPSSIIQKSFKTTGKRI